MMGWKAYRLVYHAKSPIHIGWHTLGYIKLTRYYITGKAMWGAFTTNLTRVYGKKNEPGEYEVFGELLRTNVLLSYFYSAIDPDTPLLPKFTNEGLKYGDCTDSEFERLFIKSYGQTAVLPDSNTAEDESLHESEFIAPCVGEEQRPVYFVGYVFIKDGNKVDGQEFTLESIENAIKEIFVGGDRKYGWGRLKLDNYALVSDMFGFKIKDSLKIEIPPGQPIPAHLGINHGLKLKGDIEPLVGREWGESNRYSGAGQKISKAEICWMPGSTLLEPESFPIAIGKFGILKIP